MGGTEIPGRTVLAVFGCLVCAFSSIALADPPSEPPLIVDDGAYATDPARLVASWSPSASPPGPFTEYRYAIGTRSSDPGYFSQTYPVVLTIGNSITFNCPMPVYGWYGNWGMEASSEAYDYVHTMISRLRALSPLNAVVVYSSNSAGQAGGKLADVINKIETFRGYRANLITIQMGENDSALTQQQFRSKYAEILDKLLNNNPKPVIFCFGPWSSRSTYDAASREAQCDQAISELAAERSLLFRTLRPVALNPANNNPGHALVQWHPNDYGHRGFADLFWDAMGGYVTDWKTTSATSATAGDLWLIDGMKYYWYVQGKTASGAWSPISTSDGVIADSTPPDTPLVQDDGTYTNNPRIIAAAWSSYDATSEIVEYKYAIGTRSTDPGSGYVVPWKSAGSSTSAWENIPTLMPGTCYYFYVKARNAVGLWSVVGVSDGIYVTSSSPVSVAQAKLLPDGAVCVIKNAVLTVANEVFGTAYVEQQDRTNGLGAKLPSGAREGDILEIAGIMSTASTGERVVSAGTYRKPSTGPALMPLPLRVKDVPSEDWFYDPATGAGQKGVSGSSAHNLSTIGRLVKLVGRIVSLDSQYVCLSDGSCGPVDCQLIERYRLPSALKVGDYIAVSGLSSVVTIQGKPCSLVRPRRASDCQVLLAAP